MKSTLTATQLRAVRKELERESARFGAHDPRHERYVRALDRIADGRFGACERCGGDIPLDRLLAIPETPFCLVCGRR